MNIISQRKREHSRKPDEIYPIIERCSHGPFLELFARSKRKNWTVWGNQAPEEHERFTGPTYGTAYGVKTVPENLVLFEPKSATYSQADKRKRG